MSANQTLDVLRNHYLFANLPPELQNRILTLPVSRQFRKGETLFLKGDEGNALYALVSGMVRISSSAGDGREITLNIMEPGDVFGEIAFLDGLPRTADATAMAASEALILRRSDFMPILQREPQLALHLIELLCERLRWTSETVQDAALLSLPARLAKRLLYFATLYGQRAEGGAVRITLRLSQSDIAQFMGTSRETINKQLQTWRRDGLLDIDGGRILILDRAGLQKLVESESRAESR
jgi:CRP-like cAMP-binding protein